MSVFVMIVNPGDLTAPDRPNATIDANETISLEAEQDFVSRIIRMHLLVVQPGDQMTGTEHAIKDLAARLRRRVKQGDQDFRLFRGGRHGRILHIFWQICLLCPGG